MHIRLLARLRRHAIALLALFIALGGSSYAGVNAHNSRPSKNVLLGCVGKNTGTLRIVESHIRCGSLETAVSFNREGQKGKRGPQGKRGPDGHNGAPGAQGNFGVAGKDGLNGAAGENGAKGDTGNPGAPGAKGDTGETGADGAPGAKGDTGDTGAQGAAGFTALTATAAEGAGANCATGGVKVTSGVDANRDDTLNAGEVNVAATRYVCNGARGDTGAAGAKGDTGAPGSDGLSVTSVTENPGVNCPNGGVKYTSDSGVDYVCNGAADTAAEALTKLKTVDGSGSGLDADTLDGINSTQLVQSSQFDGLFNSRFTPAFGPAFDSSIGGLFGAPDNSGSTNPSGGVDRFLAETFLTAANFPPPGTAFASGQQLIIQDNDTLFALLGTMYGGDGVTTFNLPDLRKQAPKGLHYVIVMNGLFPSRP
jgi:hypothetical protein